MAAVKVKVSPLDTLQADGVSHIKVALEKEEKGDLEAAVEEYKKGFEILLRCVHSAKSDDKKAKLRRLIKDYMDRAEELQRKIKKDAPR